MAAPTARLGQGLEAEVDEGVGGGEGVLAKGAERPQPATIMTGLPTQSGLPRLRGRAGGALVNR